MNAQLTPVYVEIKDTVPPITEDIEREINYSDYADQAKAGTLDDYLTSIICENFKYRNVGVIDKDEKPILKGVSFTKKSDVLYAGDEITGTFTVKDSSGNVSEKKSFRFKIVRDFNTDTIIDISYQDYFKKGETSLYSLLRGKIASTIYSDKKVSADDIVVSTKDAYSILGGDSAEVLRNNIINSINGKFPKIEASLAKKGYFCSKENNDFTFQIRVLDNKQVDQQDIKTSGSQRSLGVFDSIDDYVRYHTETITGIADDFEDIYYVSATIYYSDFGGACILRTSVLDSTAENKVESGKALEDDKDSYLHGNWMYYCYITDTSAISGGVEELSLYAKSNDIEYRIYALTPWGNHKKGDLLKTVKVALNDH